ncbi:MAG: glycoside hydrolase family 43 protein [Planctomycetota bacterium]|jgi:xylan 1,4-beta-xylosidase|nr:glycoside hydrolase family 43 protein [Planctomycetota bacterium]
MHYPNPIIPGFHPDPSMCRVGDDYYLVTSSFEFFPGVPVFHSTDLIQWHLIGHCLTRPEQLNLIGAPSSKGIYAPTIRHHQGRFYMVTTDTSGIKNFFVHADNPAGPWSDPILVDQAGIDPSLLFDDDGTVYFTSNACEGHTGSGLFQNEIDIATGTLTHPTARRIWTGTGGCALEAPHLYHIGDWYYIIAAEGGTEYTHMITIGRSRSPYGPFESCPHNPILTHAAKGSPDIQSTGHGDLIEDAHGQWWIVFLGVRPSQYPFMHHLGRETFIAPVEWVDDWPVVNQGQVITTSMQVERAGPRHRTVAADRKQHDDFAQPSLGLDWNFRRNPAAHSWSLSTPSGALSLRCLPATLASIDQVAWVGRRQQHFACIIETEINFDPEEDEQAGLSVLMNENYHTVMVIVRSTTGRDLILRRHVGSLVTETARERLPEGPIRLRIDADKHLYRFSYGDTTTSAMHELGVAETSHHATELAGGFTGVYFGLYASANGATSSNQARFAWCEYTPHEAT